MNLNNVLIYLNLCSTQKNSIGRTKLIQSGEIEETCTLPTGCGALIHLPFDFWHHLFHFASLLFYFSSYPQPRVYCSHSLPTIQHLTPAGALYWSLTQPEEKSLHFQNSFMLDSSTSAQRKTGKTGTRINKLLRTQMSALNCYANLKCDYQFKFYRTTSATFVY